MAQLLGGSGDARRRVFDWLADHREDLATAEFDWCVDRRAIAAAIAWAALEDVAVPRISRRGRSCGPGKVHYRSGFRRGEGNPVARQVEVAGYLPHRTMALRRRILREPRTAIHYIGAIMCAYADIGARLGFADLRCRPDLILTDPFSGVRRVGALTELESWDLMLDIHRRRDTPLEPRSRMYRWANRPDVLDHLEAAVGPYERSVCVPGYLGPPAYRAGLYATR